MVIKYFYIISLAESLWAAGIGMTPLEDGVNQFLHLISSVGSLYLEK